MERTTYDLPEGQVHVDVLAAIEREDGQWADRPETGMRWERRKLTLPVLRVTTYTGYDDTGYLRLRGKGYSIDYVHVKAPPNWEAEWTTDARDYLQRYTKTEAGNSLDWRSPTGEKLAELEQRVRDRFVAEHPDWGRASLTLRLDHQIKRAEENALRLTKEAEKEITTATQLRRQRTELNGTWPDAGEAQEIGFHRRNAMRKLGDEGEG